MHYEDELQIESAKLEVVIYTHQYLNKKKIDYQITSIRKCEYISLHWLYMIFDKTNKFFKNQELTKSLPFEKYFLVTIVMVPRYSSEKKELTKGMYQYEPKIIKIDDVSNNEDKLYQLH